MIDGMGHDLPPALWPQVVEADHQSRRDTVGRAAR